VTARLLFGTSAVLFAVVSLMWRNSVMWQDVRPFGSSGTIVAWGLAVAQVIGGAGILYPRTARPASLILGIVFVLFSLACIPGIVRAPATYAQYGNFFEQFALVCGALGVFAVSESNSARSRALGRAARAGFALCTMSFALAQIVYFQFTAGLVPTWLPPNQAFWVDLTTIAFVLAALAILIDRQARPALRLTALMLALFAVLVWIPRIIAHPDALLNWSEFAETLIIAGAAWVVANLSAAKMPRLLQF
jgi:uncharacterized membrane protein YphA (DoxX/SURF4 family)